MLYKKIHGATHFRERILLILNLYLQNHLHKGAQGKIFSSYKNRYSNKVST